MRRDIRMYLYEMRQACERVERMARGLTFDDYMRQDTVRWAIERQLTILGEALYVLSKHFPDEASEITNYKQIIAFRHALIHGYFDIKDQKVFEVATKHMEPLIVQVAAIHARFGDE